MLLAVFLSCAHSQTAPTTSLLYPTGILLDSAGNLFISDIGTHQILKLSSDGKLSVLAGTGEPGFSGDGGAATQAQLHAPHDLLFDGQGNLLIADTLNHRIRRIDKGGIITTIAGTGTSGYAGEDGPAIHAQLNGPQALAFDRAGNLVVADTYNHVVRRIDAKGVITAVAGPGPGLSGDGGKATKAQISLPSDVVVASDGSIFFTEVGNNRIRRVGPDGTIQTIAGFGAGSGLGGAGYSGDGGPAEKARLFCPSGLDLDSSGNLYISDSGNQRIRVLRQGTIHRIAGTGEIGFTGDGGPALEAVLNTPQKIAFGPDGRLYLADRGNGSIRVIDKAGIIRKVIATAKPKGTTLSTKRDVNVQSGHWSCCSRPGRQRQPGLLSTERDVNVQSGYWSCCFRPRRQRQPGLLSTERDVHRSVRSLELPLPPEAAKSAGAAQFCVSAIKDCRCVASFCYRPYA